MSVELNLGELAQRLVLRRKRDGRNIYDAVAKRELIEACMRPGQDSGLAAQRILDDDETTGGRSICLA